VFDVVEHLDNLRSWPTDRLLACRDGLIREQRRLRMQELAVVRVLDERGRIDPGQAEREGVSARTVRDTIETARALELLPAVYAGAFTSEQLGSVAALADESTDSEWAQRAPNIAPADLARLARTKTKPTAEEGRARHAARNLRMWWQRDTGMLSIRGELPDLMGARFEATIHRLTNRMRPSKGRAWEPRDRRNADALGELCAVFETAEPPAAAAKPLLVVEVPLSGPAEIVGIPLPDAMVEQLRASATVEPVLVDEHGVAVEVGRCSPTLSPKIARAVLLRDGHCRSGNCEVRHGLQIHHLRPRSWGGTDDPSNLAAVCPSDGHRQMLVPNGPWALVGNPNRPDGLRLVHVDELTAEEAEQLGLPPTRAGPRVA
jgi:HNH endonuclease